MNELHVLIEGSGRHLHVSRADLDVLFGPGFELEPKKDLSQPGQYASNQRVDVVGPRGTIAGVSILGPCRGQTQVELSFTDARIIGLNPPIRESGVLAGSPGCTLVGPAGRVDLTEGVIVAKRHIHLTPATAEAHGLADQQIVRVRTGGERALTMGEVVIRVRADFADAMHIDYDELNAGALFGAQYGVVEAD